MKIEWTEVAIKNTKKIHKFYCKIASKQVADKIIEPLFDFVKTLQTATDIGQLEECLKPLNQGHRYLVHNHTKIIYLIKENTIYITHVFDTRQNPSKLK